MKNNSEYEVRGGVINTSNERIITGYACRFNEESDYMGFYEIIDKGAITDDVIKRSDVKCYFNHDDSKGVLARSKKGEGTLKLSLDDNGLIYEFEAPNTTLGNDLYESIQRRDITESSFAFKVSKDKWEKRGNKIYRTILEIDSIIDVSPVITPAYSTTSVGLKRFNELQNEDLESYYKFIEQEFNIKQ